MYCPQCGSAIVADAAFCSKCGQEVQSANKRQDIEDSILSGPSAGARKEVAGSRENGLKSRQQNPNIRKSKKPIIIGGFLLAIAACFAFAIMLVFGQNLIGRGEKVRVLSEQKTHIESGDSSSGDSILIYTRDEHGNITKLDCTNNGYAAYSAEIAVDKNGYATSFAYTDKRTQEQYSGACQNEVDEKGRLSQSVLTTSTGTSMTVRYSYYDDTYQIKSATYSDIRNKDSENGITALISAHPPQFDDIAMGEIALAGGVWSQGASGIKSLTCYYSEDGILMTVDKDGNTRDYASGGVETREQRKGKTVTTQNGDSTFEITYDENGNRLHRKVVKGGNAPRTETTDYSFVDIKSPSKAVQIFEHGIDSFQ